MNWKTFLFALLLTLTSLEAAIEELPVAEKKALLNSGAIQIAAGGWHTCALANQKLFCWGYNKYGQTNVPPLRNPKLVSAGSWHNCALDDNGVKCWGNNEEGQTNVPPLRNPTIVSAGEYHTCALDDNGVKCWGRNEYGQTNVPPLKNPTIVSAGDYHTCALDDNGVKCWGNNQHGQTNVPPLRYPKMVSAGRVHTCTIDDNGVKCWGNNEEGQTNVPPLRNPKMVSAGGPHTCTIDDEGVKCWGWNEYGQTNVPPLRNPKMVSAGGLHTCALDDEGVKCWGFNEYGQSEVPAIVDSEFPTSRTVNFNITSLDQNFSRLSRFVYRYKESFFKGIASEIASMPLDEKLPLSVQYRIAFSRYTFLELAGPVLETTHSEIVENIYANYLSYLPVLRKQMGVNSLDDVELNGPVFKAILSSSIYALKSSKEYLLIEEEAKEQEQMLSQLQALTSPDQAKELLVILNSHRKLIDSMTQNPRLNGFGVLLEKARLFLERKG